MGFLLRVVVFVPAKNNNNSSNKCTNKQSNKQGNNGGRKEGTTKAHRGDRRGK